jgi:hypothetical protein
MTKFHRVSRRAGLLRLALLLKLLAGQSLTSSMWPRMDPERILRRPILQLELA